MNSIDFGQIPVAAYVFFFLSVVAAVCELVFAFLENELGRKTAKCFCVGCLGLMAVAWLPQAWPIYVGAFLGTLGDAFLLKKHKVWPMVLGTFSFFAGHIFYIAFYAMRAHFPWWIYVAFAVFYVLFCLIAYGPMHKIIKQPQMAFGGTIYFGILVLDFLFAAAACFFGVFNYLFLAALGGVCFIVSDCFLVYTSYVKDIKRRDFYIMATYVLAQALIILGACFTVATGI